MQTGCLWSDWAGTLSGLSRLVTRNHIVDILILRLVMIW